MHRLLPYGITQCYLPHEVLTPARQAGTRFTYSKGWKAELTWVVSTHRDGLPVQSQSPIQALTGPGVGQLCWSDTTC